MPMVKPTTMWFAAMARTRSSGGSSTPSAVMNGDEPAIHVRNTSQQPVYDLFISWADDVKPIRNLGALPCAQLRPQLDWGKRGEPVLFSLCDEPYNRRAAGYLLATAADHP